MTPKLAATMPERTVEELLVELDNEMREEYEKNPSKIPSSQARYELPLLLRKKLFGDDFENKLAEMGYNFDIKQTDFSPNAFWLIITASSKHSLIQLGVNREKLTSQHVIAVFKKKNTGGKMCFCGLNLEEMRDYEKNTNWATDHYTMTPLEMAEKISDMIWDGFTSTANSIRRLEELSQQIGDATVRELFDLHQKLSPAGFSYYRVFGNGVDILDQNWRKKLLATYDEYMAARKKEQEQ